MPIKKLSAILISLILLFALAGCGSSSKTTTTDSSSSSQTTDTQATTGNTGSTANTSSTSSTSASTSSVVRYTPGQALQLGTNVGQIDIRIDSAIATNGRLNVEINFISHASYETALTQFVSAITAEQNGSTLSEVTTTPIFQAVDDGMNETIEPADDEEVEASFALADTTSPVVLTFTTTSGATGSITLQPAN